jgi:hypothetical protein
LGEFVRIFGCKPLAAGAPGWQANANTLSVYDDYKLEFGSDTRGTTAFIPVINGQVFRTPQFPTTLPTLDELTGASCGNGHQALTDHYLKLLRAHGDHLMTVHAELEGRDYAQFFENLLQQAKNQGVEFYSLSDKARELRRKGLDQLPRCELKQESIEGRSGTLALQGPQLP